MLILTAQLSYIMVYNYELKDKLKNKYLEAQR